MKLGNDTTLCAITNLENATRAVVDAYLNNEALTDKEFNKETTLKLGTATAATAATTSTTTTTTTPKTPKPLLLSQVLQNLLLHMFVASNTSTKTYERVAHLGPRTRSTTFSSETVKSLDKQRSISSSKGTHRRPDEVLWKATYSPRYEKRPTPSTQAKPQATTNQVKPSTNEQRVKTSTGCFRCGDEGHMKKDCLKCAYCLKTGHSVKNCRRRIRDAKGKYCENCKLPDSHNTYECRKRDRRATNDRIKIVNEQFVVDFYL